ncbi:preprotein translocase subunit YajC [Weissella oryzae SG25]|uniref:Preprotein translocase subunit YajC n=1 Tax=Weissella oryzae (strain DSM 25784 / JCM 18191 / LMG 30913 / SG25) TaxID=1329250 RepID=A0A069CRF8_WEIOS|nr:preprotein translocase subunit YajC [Weissella oryzae]GAK30315.1 preprotein translocase subunit YajC [Weissella oryzae SG25]
MNSMNILLILGLFVVMYFFMIRPQQQQQKKRAAMLAGIQKGSEVILRSGLHGKIDSLDAEKKTMTIDADGVYMTFEQSAILTVVALDKHVEAKPDKHEVKREEKTVEPTVAPEATKEEATTEQPSAEKEN